MTGHATGHAFFFVVHSPDGMLESKVRNKDEDDGITYWGSREVARLCVSYGLSDWIMHKVT